MILIFECDKLAVTWKPVFYKTDMEKGVIWGYFAIRLVKGPYHKLVMEKHDWIAPDGKGGRVRLTTVGQVEKHFGIKGG